MQNAYIMLYRNKKIYIKGNGPRDIIEYEPILETEYPNVPFYINIFNDGTTVPDLKHLIREVFGGMSGKFIKPTAYVLLPDDTFGFEKKALEEFPHMILPPRKTILGSECLFISPEQENNYICVSKSNRMITFTEVKNKRIVKQKYAENSNYTRDQILGFIDSLESNYLAEGRKIYLNGEELENYSSIGTVVDKYTLIKNLEEKIK